MISLPQLLKAWSLLGSLRNRVLNLVARALTGRRVAIDWHDLRIVHPESMRIGDRFSCGRGVWLESVGGRGRLVIGERVNFSDHVHVACHEAVTIGDGVLVGSHVLITDHSHGAVGADGAAEAALPPNERTISSKGPVEIGADVWLGDGVRVLQGVRIGRGAIVGANAVVVRDIAAGTVWAGIPARQIWPRLPDTTVPSPSILRP